MVKKSISKKAKNSKKNIFKLKKFDPKKPFQQMKPKDLFEVLFEIWMDRDIESFKNVLATYLKIHHKQDLTEIGVSRDTLYLMLSEEGNPSLDTIFKILDVINQKAA